MRRLYFMLPNVAVTRSVVDELRNEGIPEKHLHAVAGATVDMEGLPEAGMLQKSEFTHGIEAGVALGGVAGILGGLLAVTFPPAGLVVGGAAIAAMGLAGAGLGAVVSGLVAKDVPSQEIEAFEAGIMKGWILLLVDVPKDEVDRWSELIQVHHPEAKIRITVPPKS